MIEQLNESELEYVQHLLHHYCEVSIREHAIVASKGVSENTSGREALRAMSAKDASDKAHAVASNLTTEKAPD